MVFFVLSGYVVAFVSDKNEKHLADFILSRAVRILSVSIPALLLTLLLSILFSSAWQSDVSRYRFDPVLSR